MQDVIIPQRVKLCCRLAATFLPSLLRDEFLCSEPALQELSFAPRQLLPVLTDLPPHYLFETVLRAGKGKKPKQSKLSS